MSVKIEHYRSEYLSGVIECLQRNFKWMESKDEACLEDWLVPLTDYKWSNSKIDENDFPYKSGMVIMDDYKIVGYLGLIYSNRKISGTIKTVVNTSTWAIDEGYGFYLIQAVKKICDSADIITSFTPCIEVLRTLKSLFKFEVECCKKLRLMPIPYEGKCNVQIKFIDNGMQINDSDVRAEYLDHLRYGIKCISVKNKKNEFFILYKILCGKGRYIRIIKCSNKKMFANYAHEIIWEMQKKECIDCTGDNKDILKELLIKSYNREWLATECDYSIFGDDDINYPLINEKAVNRLILNKNSDKNTIDDLLYSELSIMNFDE